MKQWIFLLCIVLPVCQLKGQVEKNIHIESLPAGAILTLSSGTSETVGKTPLRHVFSFHSEISVLKLKLSACGYYDTIFKINPEIDSIRIALERKELYVLPETVSDTIPQKDLRALSLVLNDFLRDFSSRNISKPVNYSDFVVLKKSGQKKTASLIFETDPAYLHLPKTVSSDSLMVKIWSDLFAASQPALNIKRNGFPGNTELCVSVISGRKTMSVRHLPGVDVSDELRSQTSVYEDDYKRVTTITYYYETVTNPTFSSSVSQTQKYNEIIFHLVPGKDGNSYELKGIAAINMVNGRMNVTYESENGLSTSSMLTRFMNSDKK